MSKTKFKKPVINRPVIVKSKSTLFQNSEAWLADKQKLIISAVITIAVLFRIIYFIQLNQGPCIWQHRYAESDMHFYDEWAKLIAHGDWLSNRSFHQYDASHQWIADYYFKTHPDEAVQLQKQLGSNKSPEALGQLLWHKWDGGKIYHQDPLYIYIVAVIYKIFGEDVRYVFVLQMIIGIFSILLIYLITRKHFGNTAALVSGMLAACCGPLMFYELVLVRESIIVFAGLLLVFLMDEAFEKISTKNFLILGVTISLCILLKSVFLLFLLLTLVLIFFIFRKQPNLIFRHAAILLAGAFVAYSPLLIRNAIVGVPLMTQNSVGSIAAIASNDVSYNPQESYELNLKNTTEILEKTGGKTLPSFIYSLKTHPGVFSYLTLVFKKFALVFHWYEFPNNKNFYYYRLHAPVLWFTFVNLLIIAPLALVGIVVAAIQRKKLWSLYLLMLMHLLLLVVFLVLSRYRIPLEAAMIPFAGFAVAEIIKNLQSKIKYALIMIAGIVGVGIWVGRPLPESITFIRGMDYQQPYNFYYHQIIDADLKKGDVNGALNTMTQFMKLEPDDVKKLNSTSGGLNSYELVLTKVYAEFHSIYSALYQKAGNMEEAQEEDSRSKELQNLFEMNDNSGSLESLVAKAFAATGDQKAILFRNVRDAALYEVKLNPNNPTPYHALKDAYENLNQPDSAISVLQQLLKMNSNDFYAVFQLGTIYGKYKNDLNNSILYLEKAKSLDPASEDVYINLGIVYGLAQQNDKAIEMMQKAASINPNNTNNLKNLELLLRRLGRNAEADEVKKKIPL
ncbi:MAG: glycosyltransferase family 39 protein [Bacteroidia bacterium]